MASARELPEHVQEFVELSKTYLRQETIEPAKRLGRYAGYSIGAAIAFAFAALFLAIATNRLVIELLPEGPYWSVLGYTITMLVIGLASFIIVKAASK